MATISFAVVKDVHEARDIVKVLQEAGYQKEEISVLVKENGKAGLKDDQHPVSTGIASGALTGGSIGLLGGLLIGFGVVAVPGIGPLLAGGPLLATLGITGAAASTLTAAAGGAVAGGAAGGLYGALVKAGVSEEQARQYEMRLKEGAALIGVATDRLGSGTADQILTANGATLVTTL